MSLSTRSYSKESRSSACYSRSSSYHASANNSYNSSYRYGTLTDDRPLSTRLIERDTSCPSLAWNWEFDDPFFFNRFRWRYDNDFFNLNYGLGRHIPISYRTRNNSSTRILPIQYTPSSTNRRPRLYNKTDNNDDYKRPDESSITRENRISSDDWPPKQGPPTHKRTSMTIFIRQPYVDQSEVPYYRQTLPTPTYPQSARIDYY